MIIENVKIFDRNSFNYTINNNDMELADIIVGLPIVKYVAHKTFFKENTNDVVIGYVDKILSYDNGIFYGNVFIYPLFNDYFECEIVHQELILSQSGKIEDGMDVVEIILYAKPLDKMNTNMI